MSLSAKLQLRQSQSVVMTPQLQQAIKLLQLSNIELTAFVETELERNPLLERPENNAILSSSENKNEASDLSSHQDVQTADEWLKSSQDMSAQDQTSGLDADMDTIFPESNGSVADFAPKQDTDFPLQNDWSSSRSYNNSSGTDEINLEAFVSETPSLCDHLTEQLNLAISDPVMRMIGQHLIDTLDDAGYIRGQLENLADRLGAPLSLVEETLAIVQTFDPIGVFARDLEECLSLQLKERDRYDPVIAQFLSHLHLLAKHDFESLKKICPDAEDLADMIAEIKNLDPKPGLRFGRVMVQPVVPDVIVRKRNDGAWHIELNNDTLPKVLVNQSYYTTVSGTTRSETEKNYLQDCLQTANWLVKSLDQRARTILKVSEEIVRQQDAFLTYGIQHLKPLNLKTVADAISMHESTVSRVTSNKYIATNRGIFELKYFFSSAIQSSGNGDAHSSEAVRYRIKQLIDNEPPRKVLSDDKIVERLKAEGIDIARRTVAKYREAMNIPSSVQRRREKKMAN
ncbi:MAG: RNA polymerase factor sigma-54 [Pseudomonadota bacterium]